MTQPVLKPQFLPDRSVLSLKGEGALAFLHNLLTCEVENLGPGQAAYGALLSPQGKIQHDTFVFNAGGEVLIDCAAAQREALAQKLKLYRLRAKLEITPRDDLSVTVAAKGFVDPRLPAMGHRGFASLGSVGAGEGYDRLRIGCGLADSDADLGVNQFFPHEANFDQWGGVSFAKGCYVGQEVVSRMQHRGTARSRILPVDFASSAPAKGTPLTSGGALLGEVLSSAGNAALGLIRLDRLAEAKAPTMAGGFKARIRKPDWLKVDVVIPEAAR